MLAENIHVDPRTASALTLVDNPRLNTKELRFISSNKSLFLSSISKKRLADKQFDNLQHWLEISIINLPAYEKLIELLDCEGNEL